MAAAADDDDGVACVQEEWEGKGEGGMDEYKPKMNGDGQVRKPNGLDPAYTVMITTPAHPPPFLLHTM